jgi:hypothetical protein
MAGDYVSRRLKEAGIIDLVEHFDGPAFSSKIGNLLVRAHDTAAKGSASDAAVFRRLFVANARYIAERLNLSAAVLTRKPK